MAYCVYCHTNKINGKRYIGITCKKPERRWANGYGYKDSPRFWNAIQKYRWDNFCHDILFGGLTREQACQMEVYLISRFMTYDEKFGYNISMGGDGTTGVLKTKEQRQRLSNAHKGIKQTEEAKAKISKAQKGRVFTEEHRKKLSIAAKKKNNLALLREKQKKKVFCFENGKMYPSIQEAARELGVSAGNIVAVCKGERKQTGGYHFEYADTATSNYTPIFM